MGVFKNIPIVNVVVGGYSVIHNIRDYNFIRQTVAFIMNLNDGKMDKQTLEEHIKKLDDSKQMNKELSKVMIFLDKNEVIKKSEILAKLYKAYIKGIIDWTKFCECVDIVNQTILQDLDFLIEINDNQNLTIEPNTNYRINRIKSLGLIIGKPY